MAQHAKVIDVTRSYLPMDPNMFPENLLGTSQEDGPDQEPPIIIYEGKNFLPTHYGYKSFFGVSATLDYPAFDETYGNVDKAFFYQTEDLRNLLVILADTGIWTLDTTTNSWVNDVPMTPLASPAHKLWTTAVIENKLYMYQQGGTSVYVIKPFPATNQLALTSYDPILPVDATPLEEYVFCIALLASATPPGIINVPTTVSGGIKVYSGSDTIFTTTMPVIGSTYRVIFTTKALFDAGTPDWHYLDLPYVDGIGITVVTSDLSSPDGVQDPASNNGVSVYENLVTSFTPSFLNMEGQIGIFRANGRLGFWDSSNSVSWSSLFDLSDMTPALTTMAGNSKFNAVLGKIISVVSMADGYVIYATRSIVGITYSTQGTLLWDATSITDKCGIAYSFQVCTGLTDKEHYVWTTSGFAHIGMPDVSSTIANKLQLDFILPQVYDYLKESRSPIRIDCLQDRYIFVSILDAKYISGNVVFYVDTIPGYSTVLLTGSDTWTKDFTVLPETLPSETVAVILRQILYDQVFPESKYVIQVETSWMSGNTPFHNSMGDYAYYLKMVEGLQYYSGTVNDNNKPQLQWTGILGDLIGNLSEADPWYNVPYNLSDLFLDPALSLNYITYPYHQTSSYVENLPSSPAEGKILAGTIEDAIYKAITEWELFKRTRYIIEVQLKNLVDILAPIGLPPGFVDTTLQFWLGSYNLDIQVDNPNDPGTSITITCNQYGSREYRIEDTVHGNILVDTGNIQCNTAQYLTAKIYRTSYTDPILGEQLIPWTEEPLPLSPISHAGKTPCLTLPAIEGLTFVNGVTSSLNPWNTQLGLWGNTVVETTYTVDLPPVTIPGYTIKGSHIIYPGITADFPPVSWLMQIGSPEPYYPTYKGAYVYDMGLQKFGKMVQDFKVLTDFSPVNTSNNGTISYSNFGMDAGVILPTGEAAIFTPNPADSWVRYGKIGYSRLGFTNILEAKVHFRTPSQGSFTVDSSYDGTGLETATKWTEAFGPCVNYTAKCDINGRWHTLTISGQYDIQYLEFRGNIQGVR